MPQPVVLIFDIGKTNKKVFLFNDSYEIVYENSIHLEEIMDEDGFPCEDVTKLTSWIRSAFNDLLQDDRFLITAVNFSAYGASFVYVDQNIQPLTPLYNYLKPYPKELQDQFYDSFGGSIDFAKTAASPVLGSLNSGMQLYRLKHERPETFQRVRWALHLPQYVSGILSGKACAELTSIGCHTNLWDFTKREYHRWVEEEDIFPKLPQILPSNACSRRVVNGRDICFGIGIHDSSAALIPYLATFNQPFVLISTGTWCISLNPFNNQPLTQDELKNDCLCYLTYEGIPVKASRLFAGHEHEEQVKRLANHFNLSPDQIVKTKYNPSFVKTDVQGNVRPDHFENIGLQQFETADEAYHALMVNIVAQQLISTNFVLQKSMVRRIFVDGGFSRNEIYMNLMAAAFPACEVFAASVPQASALGAALAIHEHWNKNPIRGNLISLQHFVAASKITEA